MKQLARFEAWERSHAFNHEWDSLEDDTDIELVNCVPDVIPDEDDFQFITLDDWETVTDDYIERKVFRWLDNGGAMRSTNWWKVHYLTGVFYRTLSNFKDRHKTRLRGLKKLTRLYGITHKLKN